MDTRVPKTHPPAIRSTERRVWTRVGSIGGGLLAAIALTYILPALGVLRPWSPGDSYVPFWNIIGREFLGEGKALEEEARQLEKLNTQAKMPEASLAPKKAAAQQVPSDPVFPEYTSPQKVEKPKWGIEPPQALEAYYRKLTLVDLGVKGAIARTGHWGDSILGVDGITSNIRNRLQARFGDAGHGFHLISRYNPSYRQQGIFFEGSSGWDRCLVAFECRKKDHRYGYGGLTANTSGSVMGRWETTKEGFGEKASRFEIWYAKQENGGNLIITTDGKRKEVVSTRGPHLEDGWHEVRVPAGQHKFTLQVSGGNVRAYGIVMENDGPGVVWDGIAHISGSTRGIRTQDEEHIKSQIKHRDVDLIVFMYGGNDMQRGYVDLKESMQPYYDEYAEVIRKYTAGKPGLPCLIMSVTDHGKRNQWEAIESVKFGKVLADAQREVAKRTGCGFFDTYEATGGVGTAARWYKANPRLLSPDLGHPNGLGHQLIAGLVTNALLYGYEEYRSKMVGAPFPELEAK